MIAGVRQFKLINALGREYDMTRPDALLHAPDGLGWGTERTVNRLGMTYIGINEKEIHQSPSGEMVFRTYEEYGRFLSFCQQGGLVLCYKPLETWYYCEALISIQKSEIQWENNHLICPVQFTLLSYWYEKVVAQTAEPPEPEEPNYSTVTGDPAVFTARYSYPIKELTVAIQGTQELNGYDKPWVGGAGANMYVMETFFKNSQTTPRQYWGSEGPNFTALLNSLPAGTYTIAWHFIIREVEETFRYSTRPILRTANGDIVSANYVTDNDPYVDKEYTLNVTFTLTTEQVGTITHCYWYMGYVPTQKVSVLDMQITKESEFTQFYPYENIAPITAYNSVSITQTGNSETRTYDIAFGGTGKNLFDINQLWAGGTTIATGNGEYCRYLRIVVPNGTYTVSTNVIDNTNPSIASVFTATGYNGSPSSSNNGVFSGRSRTVTASNGVIYVYIRVASTQYLVFDKETFSPYYVQVERGETATEYDAYRPTVYKGELNVTTGVLTVTESVVVFNGSEGEIWTVGQSAGNYRFKTTLINGQTHTGRQEVVCNIGQYDATSGGVGTVFKYGANELFFVPPQTITTVADFKTFLSSNNMVVTYPIEPLTYQLTPTQMSNLIGSNTIEADAGAVTVTYRTDARTEYKIYPYQYAYKYGDTAQNVFDISCDLPSYFKLTIFGERTNPSWRVVQNGSIVKSGKLNATIGSSQKLVINTDPKQTEITLYTLSNTRINNLYGYSDFATERIFALPQGESQVQVLTEDEQPPKVMIEVLKHV